MIGPRPRPIAVAVANSQPIANVPTRKRSPANDDTSSIPKPAKEQIRAVPSARSRPSHVPSAQKPIATALVIGLGLGPVIAYFATVETSALTQAFAGTAATVAGAGALGFFLSKDLAPWMRPLSLVVFAACVATIVISLAAGSVSPWISGGIYLLSAALIVVDFNFLRKHGTERDTIWLATGIFVSIINIFLSLLNILSGD